MGESPALPTMPRLSFEFGAEGAAIAGRRRSVVVVVDALRATTTIPTMLAQGAVRVIPCQSREDVERRRERYPEAQRAGERLCRRIEGYDMGSSPTEIAGLDLTGQTILHSTTNGTRVVRAAVDNGARAVLTGSFATLTQTAATALHLALAANGGLEKATAKAVEEPHTSQIAHIEPAEIALVATGRMKRFAVEDWLCARQLARRIEQLLALAEPEGEVLERAGQAGSGSRRPILIRRAKVTWQPPLTPDQLWEAVRHSLSVSAIQEAGLDEDLQRCLAYDTLAVAPWFDGEGFVDYWR